MKANYNQRDVRTQNRRNVLEYISSRDTVTRQDLCAYSGSSLTTILTITDFLIKNNLIKITGSAKSDRGRSPQLLKYNPDGLYSVAVDYDGTVSRIALCNGAGDIIRYQEKSASADLKVFFLEELPPVIKSFTCRRNNVLGIGISMPGDFSPDGNNYIFGAASQFENVESFPDVKSKFKDIFRLPVYFYNDSNASAYGEYLKRGKKDSDLVFIYLGAGLGSGLILDGKLRLGQTYSSGEVGYMVFANDFESNIDFPGWFEMKLGPGALETINKKSSQELENYISDLMSLVISNMSNLLDVDLFVLDGDLVKSLGETLFDMIKDKTEKLSIHHMDIVQPVCPYPSLSGVSYLVIENELDRFLSND